MTWMRKIVRLVRPARPLSVEEASDRYISRLRALGVRIGEGCRVYSPSSVTIDVTQPELVVLGNKVMITKGCTILTHGFEWCVLRELHPGEIFGSAGAVTIDDNVFIGMGSIITKNVHIGANCVIGAGSVVTRDIPSNSVAAGNPARVLMSIQALYERTVARQVDEAKAYARSIVAARGRKPQLSDFKEFFYLFATADEAEAAGLDVRRQTTKQHYDLFKAMHRPRFASFAEFLRECGIDP